MIDRKNVKKQQRHYKNIIGLSMRIIKIKRIKYLIGFILELIRVTIVIRRHKIKILWRC